MDFSWNNKILNGYQMQRARGEILKRRKRQEGNTNFI